MNGRVLILGSDGQLAQAIAKASPNNIECVGRNRSHVDITNRESVESAIAGLEPSLVINGSAYNAVDNAQSTGLEAAVQINVLGVGILARACRYYGVPLLHFSTDLVFDGNKRTPYVETDSTFPLGVYGSTKLAGENLVLSASPHNYVVRVCRLFGPTQNTLQGSPTKPFGNFPKLMLRLARERGRVRVVNDQVGTPSYTPDLASRIWQLLELSSGGLYQLSNAGEVSFADYAAEILRLANVNCEIEAVSSKEYGAAANRPLYSTLSNDKAYAVGVTKFRTWQEALAEYLSP